MCPLIQSQGILIAFKITGLAEFSHIIPHNNYSECSQLRPRGLIGLYFFFPTIYFEGVDFRLFSHLSLPPGGERKSQELLPLSGRGAM